MENVTLFILCSSSKICTDASGSPSDYSWDFADCVLLPNVFSLNFFAFVRNWWGVNTLLIMLLYKELVFKMIVIFKWDDIVTLFKKIYLFIWLRGLLGCGLWAPWLWLVGSLVAACMWDLVPWPGIEPRPPLHWECGVLSTAPPVKSLLFLFVCFIFGCFGS